jgi:ABC-type polysaccharide/polyol phosphate export permease
VPSPPSRHLIDNATVTPSRPDRVQSPFGRQRPRTSQAPLSVVWLLTARSLRQRTAGSVLGWFWLVAQPAFLLVVYTFVFGAVLGVRFTPEAGTFDFALHLMAGLMPYMAFRESLERGAGTLIGNRQLIQRVLTAPVVYPTVTTLSSVATEVIGLGLLLLAVALFGDGLTWWVLLLPVVMAARFVISLALAWVLSILTVFLRDVREGLRLILTMLFFATPILYPVDRVPERFHWVFEYNPIHHLVSAYRAVIVQGSPPPVTFVWIFALSLVALWLAYRFFSATVERAKDLL